MPQLCLGRVEKILGNEHRARIFREILMFDHSNRDALSEVRVLGPRLVGVPDPNKR